MLATRLLVPLYLVNATVLLVHQIDAAYWHEWELFGMRGGIQLNLLLNVPLVMLMLYGMQRVARRDAAGDRFSWLLAAAGFVAVVIHSYFLWQGDVAFRVPVSLGLLASTLLLSLAQAGALFAARRHR